MKSIQEESKENVFFPETFLVSLLAYQSAKVIAESPN